jgi:hypothetical protein
MAGRDYRDDFSVREIPVREILEDGRDRNLPVGTAPAPGRRWLAVLLAAAVVLTGARLAAGQHHSGQQAGARNSVTAQNSAPPSSTAGGPSRSQAPGTDSGTFTAPDPLTIPVLEASPGPMPAGLRLLSDWPSPGILEVDTGRRSTLTGLAAADQQSTRTPVMTGLPGGDVLLVYPDRDGYSGRIYLARDGRPATLIAAGAQALPGADGTILVISYHPSGSATLDPPPPPAETLAGIDRDGNELWSQLVPPNSTVLAGTRRGVLVASYRNANSNQARIALLDPETGLLRELGIGSAGLTADDGHALWLSTGCRQAPPAPCSLMSTDLSTGASRSWPMWGNAPGTALIAPDGRSVALAWYTAYDPDHNAALPGHVSVLDLITGHSSPVAGVVAAVKQIPSLAWQPDSRTLLLALSWPDHWRIASWHSGDSKPTSWSGSVPAAPGDQQLVFIPAS